ncbi:N-acetyltransferase [Clostridium paridis]|uniref:N-acetyltransferase n=1 Tax=Clostridium paridis TaxID=2803863 RepID=A0A937K6F1_9CLOT|nr:N-acetyltransferase [Clostridium paridis]MBL4933748.1 N-acetyltransferase [Clostridium paridis]
MIKELENFEVDEIMDIWLDVNITAHDFIPKQYWINNYEVVKKRYIPAATTFVFKEDNIIKGFISVLDKAFIGALFVLGNCQGCGTGKKLINHCKGIYSSLELGVYSDNVKAISFYKSCGFEIIKEQINEDSGYIEYIMKWEK